MSHAFSFGRARGSLLGILSRLTRWTLPALLFSTVALVGTAPAAGAVSGGELSAWASGLAIRARLINRYANGTYVIWHLRSEGRADGVGHSYVNATSKDFGFLLQENDVGRWRVDGDLLCLAWPTFFLGKEHCYKVTVWRPGKARFTSIGGGPSFDAYVTRSLPGR